MLASYITDKTLRFDQETSKELKQIKTGILQNSVLSPTLYQLNTYDIPLKVDALVTSAHDAVMLTVGETRL